MLQLVSKFSFVRQFIAGKMMRRYFNKILLLEEEAIDQEMSLPYFIHYMDVFAFSRVYSRFHSSFGIHRQRKFPWTHT